jgi:hypothetical protein
MLSEAQLHERKKEEYMLGNDLAFMFEEWTTEQFAVARKNIRNILKQLQVVDSQITMYDIVSNTFHLEIDWSAIADGTGHDADETEMKMVSKWRDSQITIPNNGMKSLETRTKLLTTNQNAIIGEIVVTLDPDGLSDLGLQLKTISGPMSDPRLTCSVIGVVQKRLEGSDCLQGVVQCMLGHDTLPEIATLNGHRIIPPRTSVSYSRHSCEGGLAQTYETSHGHQTWYWTVEGREFAAVPIVEIVNGNFNDFDGSYVQMVTLCNTSTIQETPLGVANLLQIKQPIQKAPRPGVELGSKRPVLPSAVPFVDCSGNLSVLIASINDYAVGIELPCGLVYNSVGIDNATPDGVNHAAILGQRSHLITAMVALNALSMELYCQRHRLLLTPGGVPTRISCRSLT